MIFKIVSFTLGGGGTKFLGSDIVWPPGNTVIMSLPFEVAEGFRIEDAYM